MKKLVSVIFAACVALVVLSVPAWGYSDSTVAVVGSAEYTSVKAAVEAAAGASAKGDTITMACTPYPSGSMTAPRKPVSTWDQK